MPRFFIVWNEGRNEGFITDSRDDADQVSSGHFGGHYSSAGYAFREIYDEDELNIQEVELPDPGNPEDAA